jgi:hypothetical protein
MTTRKATTTIEHCRPAGKAVACSGRFRTLAATTDPVAAGGLFSSLWITLFAQIVWRLFSEQT